MRVFKVMFLSTVMCSVALGASDPEIDSRIEKLLSKEKAAAAAKYLAKKQPEMLHADFLRLDELVRFNEARIANTPESWERFLSINPHSPHLVHARKQPELRSVLVQAELIALVDRDSVNGVYDTSTPDWEAQ